MVNMIDINDLKEDSSSDANLIDLMNRFVEIAEEPKPVPPKYLTILFNQRVFDYLDRNDHIISEDNRDVVWWKLPFGFGYQHAYAVIARLPISPNVGSVQTTAFANEPPRIP